MSKFIWVKVTPKASKSEIIGWKEEILCVRLHALPEKGKANEELIALLSKEWQIPKSKITIVQGKSARLKRVQID